MVRGLRRRVAVAGAAVLVMVPLGTQPASATIDWSKIIVAGISAVTTIVTSAKTEDAIRVATQQILAAVNTARSDILAEIETITVAEHRACANHAVIEFADIELMTDDNAQRFAQDATGCAVGIMSVIPSITDKGRADQLGFALNIVAPIALLARARTRLTTESLQASLRSAESNLIAALTPNQCWMETDREPNTRPRNGDLITYFFLCQAWNGDWGSNSVSHAWPDQPVDSDWIPAFNDATRNTSRAIAVAVLPRFGP